MSGRAGLKHSLLLLLLSITLGDLSTGRIHVIKVDGDKMGKAGKKECESMCHMNLRDKARKAKLPRVSNSILRN